jgi:hypothetical protein
MFPGFGGAVVVGFHATDRIGWTLSYSTGLSMPGVRQLDAGLPAAAVEQLGLHATPERLHHAVVVAVTDGSHRRHESGFVDPAGEHPGRVLRAVVGACMTVPPG